MLAVMNKDIVSFIFKGEIPGQNMQSVPERLVQAPPVQVKATKAELESPIGVSAEDVDTRDLGPTQPIRNENAIGRNDDCPCGSGKKYKNCHGANS
ncbi:preprotein translocase subunit SecA [compost metagenome]